VSADDPPASRLAGIVSMDRVIMATAELLNNRAGD
jgi:hypothetical protein